MATEKAPTPTEALQASIDKLTKLVEKIAKALSI